MRIFNIKKIKKSIEFDQKHFGSDIEEVPINKNQSKKGRWQNVIRKQKLLWDWITHTSPSRLYPLDMITVNDHITSHHCKVIVISISSKTGCCPRVFETKFMLWDIINCSKVDQKSFLSKSVLNQSLSQFLSSSSQFSISSICLF